MPFFCFQLLETSALLASHFNRERLQYGLYGLYPKYRVYVDALAIFLGMIGHSLVVSTLQNGRGIVSNKRMFPLKLFCMINFFDQGFLQKTYLTLQL